jgi:hypothetical protein
MNMRNLDSTDIRSLALARLELESEMLQAMGSIYPKFVTIGKMWQSAEWIVMAKFPFLYTKEITEEIQKLGAKVFYDKGVQP